MAGRDEFGLYDLVYAGLVAMLCCDMTGNARMEALGEGAGTVSPCSDRGLRDDERKNDILYN